ncbi:hypothetical protein ZIOFF_051089 [Zingiber officinale]|uniref:Terpene synthase metal-binding domain-containing protein n=1 Tax=Zingiber officinale TaxID=94328 RepID=A0A8J5KH05_ZINOF|nr:hypothetical protein ZIOFF_051089 [Zingiber officinale]
MEKQSVTLVSDDQGIVRKSTKYHPSVWGDYFIRNSSLNLLEESTQRMRERVEELKVQVKSMFKDTSDILQIMNLIDSIQLLRLDYHFENEIDDALRLIFEVDDKNYGLYETSLRFRLLRQRGYNVSTALAKSLKFARDRIVEGYYWVLGMYHEPQFSRARVMCTKAFCVLSIMDDIYDNYSTLDERRLLTEAIKRWNHQAVDSLPEYIKDFYLKLLKNFEEFEAELEFNEKYRVQYLQNEFKAVAIAYFEESKWGVEGYVPSLDEHLRVSLISSACSMVICSMYLGMGEVATKEIFEWYSSFPKPVEACSIIGRLLNDIRSHEMEQERDHAASTVESYMKEHGTNVKVACQKLREMVEKAWKNLNKESLNPTPVARPIIERILSFSKSMEDVYRYTDEYTTSDNKMKDNISLVLVEPIPI